MSRTANGVALGVWCGNLRALVLGGMALLAGCGTPPKATPEPIAPRFRPTFQALDGAIKTGDDDLARGILVRLRATELGPSERLLADNLERVMLGRQLADSIKLDLSLGATDKPGAWELILSIQQDTSDPVILNLPPLRLSHGRYRIDSKGVSSLEERSQLLPFLSDRTVKPGEHLKISLTRFEVPMHGALALRDEWQLEFLAGNLRTKGVDYPTSSLAPARLEQSYLADFLPTEPLDPEVLVEFARRPNPATAPLIERAVRIPPAQADVALDALEPLLVEFLQDDPERVVPLVPVLCWLSRTSAPGVDPEAWLHKIRARRQRREQEKRAQERAGRRLRFSPEDPDSIQLQGRGGLQLPPSSDKTS